MSLLVWLCIFSAQSFVCWSGCVLAQHCLLFAGLAVSLLVWLCPCWSGCVFAQHCLLFAGLAVSLLSTVFCFLVWLCPCSALSFVCWSRYVLAQHSLLFAGLAVSLLVRLCPCSALSFVCWSGCVLAQHSLLFAGLAVSLLSTVLFAGLAVSLLSTVFCLLVWLCPCSALSFVCWSGCVLVQHCLLFAGLAWGHDGVTSPRARTKCMSAMCASGHMCERAEQAVGNQQQGRFSELLWQKINPYAT